LAIEIGVEREPLNFTGLKRGDTIKPVDFTWSPTKDFSGYTLEAQIRSDLDETEASPVASFTVDDSQAASGIITISLPASESRKLATPHALPGKQERPGVGAYYWDLQATNDSDAEDVFTWVDGTITVEGDATVSA